MSTYRVSIVVDLEGEEKAANMLYMMFEACAEAYGAEVQDLHGGNVEDITNP